MGDPSLRQAELSKNDTLNVSSIDATQQETSDSSRGHNAENLVVPVQHWHVPMSYDGHDA